MSYIYNQEGWATLTGLPYQSTIINTPRMKMGGGMDGDLPDLGPQSTLN